MARRLCHAFSVSTWTRTSEDQAISDYVGPCLRVDLHVDVDGEVELHQAHAIADQVQRCVEALPEVDLAFVHVEPVDADVRRCWSIAADGRHRGRRRPGADGRHPGALFRNRLAAPR